VPASRRWRGSPELNVFGFGVIVNYPWELLQTPLFQGMSTAPHFEATRVCTLAALGDGALLVAAFWAAAAAARSRHWLLHPRGRDVLMLVLVGQALNVALEWLNTEVWQRWAYAPVMPIVPLLGTGLSPLLQWLLLPPLVVAIVRRQLHGELALAGRGGSRG
jgi:hypothetical protein